MTFCRIDAKTDGCQLDLILLSETVADEEVWHWRELTLLTSP